MAQLTFIDLMDPNGPVTPTLFPEQALNIIQAKVTSFLAEAYSDSRVSGIADADKQNRTARAWALFRVFDSVAIRMTAEPLDVNNGAESGSHGYDLEQVTKMEERAARYLEEFNGLAVVVGAARPPMFVRNVVTW